MHVRVPTHNSKQYEVIASVVTHETPPQQLQLLLASLSECVGWLQTIVVDNSPSLELRATVEEHDAIYISVGKNLGFGAGHNIALKTTLDSAKYHLVINPDIAFKPAVIESLYQFMENHSDLGLVMPRIFYPDGTEQRLCKLLPSPFDLFMRRFLGSWSNTLFKNHCNRYELTDLDMGVIRQVPSLSGCFMFIRTAVLREVGLFDERYFMYLEDVDLCRRIGRVSQTVFNPHVSVVHGYAKGSYQSTKLLKHHIVSAVKYFSKWGWFHDPERDQLNRRTAVMESSVFSDGTVISLTETD
jgi:GT2 family glycosyltransferase